MDGWKDGHRNKEKEEKVKMSIKAVSKREKGKIHRENWEGQRVVDDFYSAQKEKECFV